MVTDGASATSCTSSTFAGPAPASEPEFKNLIYVDEHFNIKYSMNVHSSGGYFMWPPGAYIASGRVTLPAPNIGVEKYFWAASDRILNRVKEERGTAIQPGQTGAVVDVLYSAAGNTADDEYYNYGILGWDFEVGAGIYNPDDRPLERPWLPTQLRHRRQLRGNGVRIRQLRPAGDGARSMPTIPRRR